MLEIIADNKQLVIWTVLKQIQDLLKFRSFYYKSLKGLMPEPIK